MEVFENANVTTYNAVADGVVGAIATCKIDSKKVQ